MVHDSARPGAIGLPGLGRTSASWSPYRIMYGVMIPEVSAGSNHVGASETCTAQVIWPSGAATTGDRGASASIRTINAPTRTGTCLITESSPEGSMSEGAKRPRLSDGEPPCFEPNDRPGRGGADVTAPDRAGQAGG